MDCFYYNNHPEMHDVTVKLDNGELWKKFNKLNTEMIITKSGRRMFPTLKFFVQGLEAHTSYSVSLDFQLLNECRYKYSSTSNWSPAGSAETQSGNQSYVHPESPSSGAFWMSQAISFSKLKITNSMTMATAGQVVLSSMHKYQPILIITKSSEIGTPLAWSPRKIFHFPETHFIAVTAYQNEKITQLKIDFNPFAKGFRENGQAKCKRKQLHGKEPTCSSENSRESSKCDSEDEIIVVDDKPSESDLLQEKVEIPSSSGDKKEDDMDIKVSSLRSSPESVPSSTQPDFDCSNTERHSIRPRKRARYTSAAIPEPSPASSSSLVSPFSYFTYLPHLRGNEICDNRSALADHILVASSYNPYSYYSPYYIPPLYPPQYNRPDINYYEANHINDRHYPDQRLPEINVQQNGPQKKKDFSIKALLG